MRDYHYPWAHFLANMYANRVDCGGLDYAAFGVSGLPQDVKKGSALKADLRQVQEHIKPEQEGILLWFMLTDRLPAASPFVNGTAKHNEWMKMVALDECYIKAKAVRKDRVERLCKLGMELREHEAAGRVRFGFMCRTLVS